MTAADEMVTNLWGLICRIEGKFQLGALCNKDKKSLEFFLEDFKNYLIDVVWSLYWGDPYSEYSPDFREALIYWLRKGVGVPKIWTDGLTIQEQLQKVLDDVPMARAKTRAANRRARARAKARAAKARAAKARAAREARVTMPTNPQR